LRLGWFSIGTLPLTIHFLLRSKSFYPDKDLYPANQHHHFLPRPPKRLYCHAMHGNMKHNYSAYVLHGVSRLRALHHI
jgi:hypothetical protein